MKQTMKSIMRSTCSNWVTILCFEIFYKIIGYVFVFPLLQYVLSTVLKILNTPFLSQENVAMIFKNWSSVLFLILFVFIIALYLYFEIVAHIYYCEAGWRREYCSLWKLCKISFFRAVKIFHYKNILLLIVLPLISLTFFSITGWLLKSVKIPEFIMDFIFENPVYLSLYVVSMLIINILLFFYLFGIPAMVINGESFFNSWKLSIRLLKNNKKNTIKIISVTMLVFLSISIIGFYSMVLILVSYSKYLFVNTGEAINYFQHGYLAWSRIGQIIVSAFGMIILIASIVTLYHQILGEEEPVQVKKAWTMKKFLKKAILAVTTLITIAIFSETEMAGRVFYSLDKVPIIVAHRAGALFAPENTLKALNTAIEDKADMAEIDVQQTKDGTLIVMHDTNFNRVAGVDKNVWDTEYKEVKTFNAGKYFSKQTEKEPFPTLEQMLMQAKDKIQLMIELKVTGRENELERKTINLIKKYGMEKQSVICSMNLETLKKVKQLDSSIKTIYITAVLIAEEYNLSFIDGYSVEVSFISREMVYAAESQNKKIFAWTPNSEDTINKVIYSEADGIVTDNVPMANFYIDTRGEDSMLESLTDSFFNRQE